MKYFHSVVSVSVKIKIIFLTLFKFKAESAEEALGERGGSAVQGSIYSLAQRG